MSKRFIGFSILVCVVLASTLLANGPDTPPTAEDVYGLKAWIEENVSAADVSAEIEGAVSAHAGDTSTHGVAQVADEADLSAHIASTGTDVHGLGTMAAEAKTDYVATGTFTSHTGDSSDPHGATLTQTTIISDSVDGVDVSAHVADNSDVHGCTAIASASAVADALSAANASDALNLRINGSRAMTGNLRLGGMWLSNDGGNEGVFVDTAGKVGIGNAAPAYLLSISSRFGFSSSGVFDWGQSAAHGELSWDIGKATVGAASASYALVFKVGAVESARCAPTTGNVLIGTTTDDGTNKLQVNGSVAISSFMQLASPTAIPTAAPGRIYFNGTESKFKKCLTGTTWVDM